LVEEDCNTEEDAPLGVGTIVLEVSVEVREPFAIPTAGHKPSGLTGQLEASRLLGGTKISRILTSTCDNSTKEKKE
jgi:hypothetical protein